MLLAGKARLHRAKGRSYQGGFNHAEHRGSAARFSKSAASALSRGPRGPDAIPRPSMDPREIARPAPPPLARSSRPCACHNELRAPDLDASRRPASAGCRRFALGARRPAVAQLLAEAVTAFRAALEVQTRQELPQDWAMTQYNLGAALSAQAAQSSGPVVAQLLAEAVTAFRAALEVYTRQEFPQDWAATQNNLGAALGELAAQSSGPTAAQLLAKAVTAFCAALEVRTRQEFPQDWAATQNNLGSVLRAQAGQSSGPAAAQLLAEAVKAYRAALEVYTEAELPNQHATASNNLKLAETDLQKLKP